MEYLVPVLLLVVVIVIYRSRKSAQAASEANREAGVAFLIQNAKEDGVITTESGLQYKVLNEGTGTVHPGPKSKVRVHYHGTLIDGTVFDSSVDRGEPIEFGLHQVIKGWTEGLQLMVEGEKVRLFIPPDLAYGNGAAGVITPGSTLIFDVELLSFSH